MAKQIQRENDKIQTVEAENQAWHEKQHVFTADSFVPGNICVLHRENRCASCNFMESYCFKERPP